MKTFITLFILAASILTSIASAQTLVEIRDVACVQNPDGSKVCLARSINGNLYLHTDDYREQPRANYYLLRDTEALAFPWRSYFLSGVIPMTGRGKDVALEISTIVAIKGDLNEVGSTVEMTMEESFLTGNGQWALTVLPRPKFNK